MKHALALLATLLLAQFVTAHAAKPGSDKTQLDITYKTTTQGPLCLDLHYSTVPQAGAKYPLVIFTHGGGWAAGDKSLEGVRKQGVKALTAQGFCVASVDYRLCKKDGNIRIRDCVTDSKDALRFLAKNAPQFSLDTSRVFTFGVSAGGQIAQLLLLSPPESFPGDPALTNAQYRFIAGVSWYGPCDFEKTELFNGPGQTGVRDRFGARIINADADAQTKLAAYREVSPVNYLRPASPPLLLVQGDKDPTIPVHHARYIKERAAAVKAPVEIVIVQNAGHNWRAIGGPLHPTLDEIVAKTAAFMKQHLDHSLKQ
jgi:acetyl esterase/lipase